MHEMRDGHARENSRKQPRQARLDDEAAAQRRCDPRAYTKGARDQIANGSLHPRPTRLLVYLASARGFLERRKRCAERSGHAIFCDEPAYLVRSDAQQQKIAEAEPLGQRMASLFRSSHESSKTRRENSHQDCVLR
jgi:hypothetical protein